MAEETASRSGLEDERICGALAAYFEDLEAGRRPDPREIIALHPELERELSEVFAMDRILAEWADGPSRADAGRPSRSGGGRGEGEAGEAAADAWELAGPRLIGDHLLLEEVGRGGMGVVFRAWQRGLRRVVALKVVSAGRLATDSERRRFHAEAEAAAALDHPHIVPIYEIGHDRGCSFYTMRLIEGGCLARRLDDFRDRPREAVGLVILVARAIHHAHQRGVLHRDLKPSNILLDAEGGPHVSDFGLAKRSGGPDLTLTGDVLGSPPYMAPEQAGGHGGTTIATDVYGLGAILYALLGGRPPFEADSAIATIDLVRNRPPTPPRTINPNVDRDLQTICLKCLEKAPEARYATAGDLAEDLRRWLDGEPILARAASRPRLAWLWCRDRRRMRDAAVLALVLGLMLCVLVLVGIAAIVGGAVPSRNPAKHLRYEWGWLLLGYVPAVGWAWAALRGRAWAFWGGLLHTLLMAAYLAVFITHIEWFGAQDVFPPDPGEEAFVHVVIFCIFGLLALVFAEGALAAAVGPRDDPSA